MGEKNRIKRITVILAALFFAVAAIICAATFGSENYVFTEAETSLDAGVLDIKDDFRFCGTDKSKTKTNFTSCNNVSTFGYGSYTYGLIPASNFNSTVNTGNGEIIYTFSLEGNGEFLLIRSLSLTLDYSFENDIYNPSITVYYKADGGDYTQIKNIDSATENGKIIFDDVLNELSTFATADKLYVKISLNHDTADSVPIDNVSLRLFSVNFYGAFNFVMKKGASLRLSNYTSYDLKFRAFIAKDVYEKIIEKYPSDTYTITLGNIIFPLDLTEKYNAHIERNNLEFYDGFVYVGNYTKNSVKIIAYPLTGENDSPYSIKVNGVIYYYFDGYISRIKPDNLTRKFTSKSYVRITRNASKEQVFLSVAAYSNQDIELNSKSAVYCAQKLAETNELLTSRLYKIFIRNIPTDKDKHITTYNVRKFYVDAQNNIVYVDNKTYNATVNQKIILTDSDKQSERAGFEYIGDNGKILDGEKIIYCNSEYDKAYPVYDKSNPIHETVINLYYKAS